MIAWIAESRALWKQSKLRRRIHEWWLIVMDPRRAAWRVVYLGTGTAGNNVRSLRLGYMDARTRAKIFEPAIVVFDPRQD